MPCHSGLLRTSFALGLFSACTACGAGESVVAVAVTPDRFYWETSWFLQVFPGGQMVAAGEWTGKDNVCVSDTTLANSRLVLTVQDLQRDGLGPGGSVQLSLGGVVVAEVAGNFGSEHVMTLTPGCSEEMRIDFAPDANAEFETTWDIYDGSGKLLGEGTSAGGIVCAPRTDEYVLSVRDSFGDGLGRSGSYSLSYEGRVVASGAKFGHLETTRFSPGCKHTLGVHVDTIGDTLFQQQPDPTWQLRDVDSNAVLLSAQNSAHSSICSNVSAFELSLQVESADVTATLFYDGSELALGTTQQQTAQSSLSLSYRCNENACCPIGFIPEWDSPMQSYECAMPTAMERHECTCSAPSISPCACTFSLSAPSLSGRAAVAGLSIGIVVTSADRAGVAVMGVEIDGEVVGAGLSCNACIPLSSGCCEQTCVADLSVHRQYIADGQVELKLTAGGTGANTGWPANGDCSSVTPWANVSWEVAVQNFCSSDPCLNGGACTEATGAFHCECMLGYAGDVCQWDTVQLDQTCSCALPGCSCTSSFNLSALLGNHLQLSGAGVVLDSARLYTTATGDFSNAVEKYVKSTEIDGATVAALGAVCYPDCICCSRGSPCLQAYDITSTLRTKSDLDIDVRVTGSARVGEGTGCPKPEQAPMAMTATLEVSMFRTLTLPCQCQGAGCTCLVQFFGLRPEGTEIEIAWVSISGTGDLSGIASGEYIESIKADSVDLLESALGGVQCDCCANPVPFVQRANVSKAAADGQVSIAVKGSSGLDECGLDASVVLGYSLVSVDMCLTSPCLNRGVCENKPSLSGRAFTCNCIAGFSGDTCELCSSGKRILTVVVDTYNLAMDPALLWSLYDDTNPDPVAGGQKLASSFFRKSNSRSSVNFCTSLTDFALVTSNMGTTQWGTWYVVYDGLNASSGVGDSRAEFGCTEIQVNGGNQWHCCPKGYYAVAVSNLATCACAGHELSVVITPDLYPNEISFSIRAPAGGEVVLVGGFEGGTYCGPEDSFEVRVKDEHDDGFCCEHGAGEYSLILDDNVLVHTLADFRHEDIAFLLADCKGTFEVGLTGPYERVVARRDPFSQELIGIAPNVHWSITKPILHHTTPMDRVMVNATKGCLTNDCESKYPGSGCVADNTCNFKFPLGYGMDNPSQLVLPRDQPPYKNISFWEAVPAFKGTKLGSVEAPGRTWYCLPELVTDSWGVGTSYVLNVSDRDGGSFGWDLIGEFYLKINNTTQYRASMASMLGYEVNRDTTAPYGWAFDFSCGPAKPPAYVDAWCCNPGYYTKECIDFDECSINNGGCDVDAHCTNLDGDFSCSVCPYGLNGTLCTNTSDGTEYRLTKAMSNISKFETGRYDTVMAGLWHPNVFDCRDSTGFFVDGCVNIDDCYSSPCRNGGVCVDEVDAYHCDCIPPYVGDHCQYYAHPATSTQRCLCPPDINTAPCVCDVTSLKSAFPSSAVWDDYADAEDEAGNVITDSSGQPVRVRTPRILFWNGSLSITKTGDYFPSLSIVLNWGHKFESYNLSSNGTCAMPPLSQFGQCETPVSCDPAIDMQRTLDVGGFETGFIVSFNISSAGGSASKCANAAGVELPIASESACVYTGNTYTEASSSTDEACTSVIGATNQSNCTSGVNFGTSNASMECAAAGGVNSTCVYTAAATATAANCTNGGDATSRASCERNGNSYTKAIDFVLKQIPGCMETSAYNYDWKANVDDGTCKERLGTFTAPLSGKLITLHIGAAFAGTPPECAMACEASVECESFNWIDGDVGSGTCFLYNTVALGKRSVASPGYLFDFPVSSGSNTYYFLYYERGEPGCNLPSALNYRPDPEDGTRPTVKPWWIDCDLGIPEPAPPPAVPPAPEPYVAPVLGDCDGATFGVVVDFFVADNDDCISIPCQNGGTCQDDVDSFLCTCAEGFLGNDCSEDVDECLSNPCQYGNCIDGYFKYSCECPSCAGAGDDASACGFSGANCSYCYGHHWQLQLVPDGNRLDTSWDLRDMATDQIMLRGEYEGADFCVNASTFEFTIRDRFGDGFAGTWDVYADGFLQASSKDQPFFGMVAPGVFNATRQTTLIDVNDCLPNPLSPTSGLCKRGHSTCRDGINEYACICLSGYEHCRGPGCVATCAPSALAVGANATACRAANSHMLGNESVTRKRCMEAGGGHCIYTPGRPYCEVEVDECAAIPCMNGGSCTDFLNNYTCNCLDGFGGYSCEVDVDDCAELPCQNAGRCIDGINSFVCECGSSSLRHYEGTVCEIVYYSGDLLMLLMVVCCLPLAYCLHGCRTSWAREGSCIRGAGKPSISKYAVAVAAPSKEEEEEQAAALTGDKSSAPKGLLSLNDKSSKAPTLELKDEPFGGSE